MEKSITQLLEDILSAVYGEDVRKSIHDAILKSYEDATKGGNANMEVSQARGIYTSLSERLAADLSNTIKRIDEGDSRLRTIIDSVVSGSPLVASSISEMVDTSRVYVNTTDGHWYWYNGSAWQDGGIYQAAEDSDTVNLLENDLNHSTNSIDYNQNSTGYVHTSTAMSASDGRINTGDAYEAYTALYFIPVTYGDIIKFSGASGANRGNIVGYSTNNANSFIETLLTKTENTILENEEVIITNRNIHYIGVTYRTRENVPYSLNVKKNPLVYALENKEKIETITPIVYSNQDSIQAWHGNTTTLVKKAQLEGTIPVYANWEIGDLDNSTGEEIEANSRVRNDDFIEVPVNTTNIRTKLITDYVSTPPTIIRYYKYNENHEFISMTGSLEEITITKTVRYIKIVLLGTNLENAKNCVVTFTAVPETNVVPTIDELNDPHYIKNTLAQVAMGHCTGWQKPNTSLPILKLLHFTDIHGNEKNLKRIIDFKNEYSDYIDDVICTGDMVTVHYEDGMTFWNNANAGSVMMCIGNHDVTTLEDYEGNVVHGNDIFISLKRCYDAYIAPYVANWNVVQPSGVNDPTSPYYAACYYYKDYTTYGIRLIMLDNLHWDNNQSTWLTNVLEDARNNNLAVIATQHFPVGETTSINTTFCVPRPYERYTPNTAGGVSNISTFINNGGEFICWLTGHYHQDGVGRLVADNRQLDINMDLASYFNTTETKILLNEKSMDCFQVLSFDTTDKYIRMYRIGRDMDRYLQKKSVFCYDYANHKLIYNG